MKRFLKVLMWSLAGLALGASAQAQFGDPRPLAGKYADYAQSDNDRSLMDRNDPILNKWISNTIENVIEVRNIDRSAQSATVYAASAKTAVTIPLGWYAIDDGERGAAFVADETVRLILRQVDLAFEGVSSIGDYAQVKRGLLLQQFPKIRTYEVRLGPDMVMNVYEAVPARPNDKAPRTIFDIVTASPKDPKRANLMTFGVPDGQGQKYLPLLGLLLRDRKIEW